MTGYVGNNSRQKIFSTTTVTVFRKNLVEAMGGGAFCLRTVRTCRLCHHVSSSGREKAVDDKDKDEDEEGLAYVRHRRRFDRRCHKELHLEPMYFLREILISQKSGFWSVCLDILVFYLL